MSGIRLMNAISAAFPLGCVVLYIAYIGDQSPDLRYKLLAWAMTVLLVGMLTILSLAASGTNKITEEDGYIAYKHSWWWPIAMHVLIALLPTIGAAAVFLMPMELMMKLFAVAMLVVLGPPVVHWGLFRLIPTES